MALEVNELPVVWLATQRKPLEDVEPIWILRWLLRRYFAWRGFACRSHVCNNEDGRHGSKPCDGQCYASIEYRGAYTNESDARWVASCDGGAYKPIPFNGPPLPEQTVSFGCGDVPMSEASAEYRKGIPLAYEAIPRGQIERKVEQIIRSASA